MYDERQLPGLHRSAHVGCTPTYGWYYNIMACKNLFHMCCTLTCTPSNILHIWMHKCMFVRWTPLGMASLFSLTAIADCNGWHEEDHARVIEQWVPGWWALYKNLFQHSDLPSWVHVARTMRPYDGWWVNYKNLFQVWLSSNLCTFQLLR